MPMPSFLLHAVVAPAGQAVASMPYGQERFGGQSVAPAGQTQAGWRFHEVYPYAAALSSATFLASISSGCAQWASMNATLKQTLVRGWYQSHPITIPTLTPDEILLLRQRQGLIASAGQVLTAVGQPPMPFTAADIAQGVARVDQYCAIQNQQQNVGAVASRAGFPGASLLPRLYPAGQAMPAGSPPNAFGADNFGQCVDIAGNVLSATGANLGAGNVQRSGAATCSAPINIPTTTLAPPAPVGVTPVPAPATGPLAFVSNNAGWILGAVVVVAGVGLGMYMAGKSLAPTPSTRRASYAR